MPFIYIHLATRKKQIVVSKMLVMELKNYTLFAPYDYREYPAIKGLLHLFHIGLFNGASEGTGITYVLQFTSNILGNKLPDVFVKYAVSFQLQLFGSYPTESYFTPCLVFTILFGIAGIFHFLLFFVNYSRGHYFWISFVWGVNCCMKLTGFALLTTWSKDITKIRIGLVGEVLLIIPSVIFVSFDLILAQRLFTWRHPVGGSRRLFWNFMFTMYAAVLLLIGVTIMAAYIPYMHLLSYSAWQKWRRVNMATGLAVILYSLTSMALIMLSYIFPPTTKDENLYTYQPWWIESFGTFYFVQPGAAQEAEETFMKRNHNHRHAIRVIAATHHHYNMVEGLTNQRGNLKHNTSILIIFITTVLIFIGSMARCVTLFQDQIDQYRTKWTHPAFMFVCWGGFELLINILYIIGRVDLRFYRPDVLPAKVRAIITAEQSYYPSDNEEEMGDSYSSRTFSTVSDKSFPRAPASPPYPRDDILREKHDDKDDDNLSDFHF